MSVGLAITTDLMVGILVVTDVLARSERVSDQGESVDRQHMSVDEETFAGLRHPKVELQNCRCPLA
jgi:hypothetical protein